MNRPEGDTRSREVLRVGLTGGIATGKSVAAAAFGEQGAFVLDADTLGHELMEPGMPAHGEIRAAFGDGILSADGRIDRKKLGARIFADPGARQRLNAILHPRILAEVEGRILDFARRSPGGIVVVQAALVVEAGVRSRFDRIVVTHCDPEIQARRIVERDGISREEAGRRISAQAEPGERLAAADHVIDTSGSLDETRTRAREVFTALRREWERLKTTHRGDRSMDSMNEGQARRILEMLLSRGGDFGEIYLQSNRYVRITLDDGRLEEILAGEDAGVSLRLVAGERTFFYSGNDLDPGVLEGEASRLALALEPGGGPGKVAPLRPTAVPAVSEVKIPPGSVDLGKKVALLRRAEKAAREADPRVSQFSASYGDSTRSIAVINSDGTWAREVRVYSSLFGSAIAREGEQLRTGYHSISETRGFELFDEHPPEEVGREAARIALVQISARPAPAGTFTVVLSSKAGGTMIHEACGHGLEGDFAEKSLSVYAGRLGERVASDLITVVDDGTLPNKRGSSGMDDEGTPSSRVVLIERGILKSYLHSRRTARKLGHSPTGNGRRESYRHLPIPRMRNTLIVPGTTPPDEILASVKEGIYVCQMGGGEVDIASGSFIFNVGEAYMIRDGRLAEPIRDATLIGNGPEVLGSIDAVGSDLGYGVGTCGKDGQQVPVADAQPTLRIPKIVVGGTVARAE